MLSVNLHKVFVMMAEAKLPQSRDLQNLCFQLQCQSDACTVFILTVHHQLVINYLLFQEDGDYFTRNLDQHYDYCKCIYSVCCSCVVCR